MPERIRIYIWQDLTSESMQYIAAAESRGSEVHRIARHGGSKVEEELFQEMVTWLVSHQYDPPDYYWAPLYPH